MKKHISYIYLALIILVSSCGKEEYKPFDEAFLHIMNNNQSTETVNYMANAIRTYTIYLSSKPRTSNLEVTFQITAGSGLKEGVDYEVLTNGNSLSFLPGIYDMPIRIRWIANPLLDSSKDNTLTIELTGNNQNINLGLPGPNHNQSKFIITKVK